MPLNIIIPDEILSEGDKTILKNCLGLKTDNDLKKALSKIGIAAFAEYCKMFKERGIPTRADEVMQERLFFLLNYYFDGRLPNESDISAIFHLTPSQSRTLLRNTKSRYRTKIEEFINNTLSDVIKDAEENKDTKMFEFICYSRASIEELNLILSQKGPALAPITKSKDTGSKYECVKDTYNKLKEIFNL